MSYLPIVRAVQDLLRRPQCTDFSVLCMCAYADRRSLFIALSMGHVPHDMNPTFLLLACKRWLRGRTGEPRTECPLAFVPASPAHFDDKAAQQEKHKRATSRFFAGIARCCEWWLRERKMGQSKGIIIINTSFLPVIGLLLYRTVLYSHLTKVSFPNLSCRAERLDSPGSGAVISASQDEMKMMREAVTLILIAAQMVSDMNVCDTAGSHEMFLCTSTKKRICPFRRACRASPALPGCSCPGATVGIWGCMHEACRFFPGIVARSSA